MRRCLLAALGFALSVIPQARSVEFVVHVPESTPPEARVFLSGDDAQLGAWKADGVELQRGNDGTWHVDLPLKVGQHLQYKFTLGTWDTVEKKTDGSERANRVAVIDESTREIRSTVERWASGAADRGKSTVVGSLTLHTINSTALGTQRTLRVWLPPDYDAHPEDRFAVLYLQDGQNLFDRKTSAFGNEWMIDEALTRLIAQRTVPPLIVVGVDNGPERIAEYTFVADPRRGGGRGTQYAHFLLEEVRPLINKTYRTRVDPENTFIGGSSLGGLVSLEIARRHPDDFGGVIAMSPSLWWANQAILTDLERDASGLAHTRIWVDMGTREGDAAESNVEQARRLSAILTKQMVEHQLTIAQDAEHNEPAWAARFPAAIEYLLKQK